MKKIQFVVTPNSDDEIVQKAFEQYFLKPTPINLLYLAEKVLAHAMSITNVKSLDLIIDKSIFAGGYGDGKIKLNKSLFKHAKKKQAVIDMLEALFHELTHAIIEINNLKILQTKQRVTGYLPPIDLGRITQILNIASGDMEFACTTSMYLYRRNKNELIARKHAHYLLVKYLKTFAGNISFEISSFDEKEKKFQDNLYKMYPDVKYLVKYVDKMIIDYQNGLINRGLNNISQEEFRNLVSSINVLLTEETKVLLVKACVECSDISKVKELLQTPVIKITSCEQEALQNKYGKDVIQSIVFTDNECQKCL